MKKLKFKSTALLMLLTIAGTSVLFNGCQKNVSDVYEYVPEVFAPDFTVVKVDYTSDNTVINSESNLTFKVTYRNNEDSKNTYNSVLNFYVDGAVMESVLLTDIDANKDYESILKWSALAGKHNFKFEINISSDGSQVVKEENTSNNAKTTAIDVAVKQIVVVNRAVVDVSVVESAVKADTSANVATVIASEGLTIATTVEAVKTTFDDKSTAIVSALMDSEGTIDSTKEILSYTVNPNIITGQQQQSTTTVVVETIVEEKKVSFYNDSEELTYKNGVITFVGLKSASVFLPCSEPTNFQMLDADPEAMASLLAKINSAITTLGVEAGLNRAKFILIEVTTAYGYTQGNVDNPPIMTSELISSDAICSSDCIDGFKVNNFSYLGFRLEFDDDRNDGVILRGTTNVITSYIKSASCDASNNGTYIFEDCGGQSITFVMSEERPKIVTTIRCSGNVHN